jgi:hypothetical protein
MDDVSTTYVITFVFAETNQNGVAIIVVLRFLIRGDGRHGGVVVWRVRVSHGGACRRRLKVCCIWEQMRCFLGPEVMCEQRDCRLWKQGGEGFSSRTLLQNYVFCDLYLRVTN